MPKLSFGNIYGGKNRESYSIDNLELEDILLIFVVVAKN